MTITIPENKTTTKHIDTIISDYFSRVDTKKIISFSKFEIPTRSNEIPILKPYNTPLHMQDLQKKEIQELLDKDIIKKSTSLFASPCFIKKETRWHWTSSY
ncbi:hypothetical protein DMUE_4005 [Dictyocoela muelleri]|nr:hypothetical protein DMUE_4005 [Dictyocoela muelleri]